MLKLLSVLIYGVVRFFHITYRYRYVGCEHLRVLADQKQNFILGIWHRYLFGGILAQSGLPHIVIVSKSKDAAPVAYVCKKFGHFVVRGSSKKGVVDKGGALAKAEMIHFLKEGRPGAVTVDGPKGPAFKVKPGIIDMARLSSSVIVPYTVVSNSYWQFKSWDQFQLPKPFAQCIVAYGKPLTVATDVVDFSAYQIELEESLNALTVSANAALLKWNEARPHNWFL